MDNSQTQPGEFLDLSQAILPYGKSRLSPSIVPTDLTSFKTQGIGQVEKELRERLSRLQEEYLRTVEAFQWNKIVYESEFHFEPVMGSLYHLYEMGSRRILSMIPPEEWPHPWIASLRLTVDRRWELQAKAENFRLFPDKDTAAGQ